MDYEESSTWYYEHSIPAGDGFVEDFEQTMARICTAPLRYPATVKDYHEVNMRRYPFKIIYTIDDETPLIIIIRIFHHSRNPEGKYPLLKLITYHSSFIP